MASNQIFVSYSRQNSAFVERLTNDLREAGFNVWRDMDKLTPGTPNWEKAIRTAIQEAAAVVYVASPTALASQYVQGELTVTQLYNRPIYPIWAAGDNWIECVPLGMTNYQYVDGRENNYTNGFSALVETLKRTIDTSQGSIRLGLPTHETIEINLALFDTATDLLNYVYLNYLQYWYEPVTYGFDWVLGNVETKQLAVTWDWLSLNHEDTGQALGYAARAGLTSVENFGVKDGSHWAVWDMRWVRAAGVVLQDFELAEKILAKDGERELWLAHEEKRLKIASVTEVHPPDYATQFVVAVFQTSKRCFAFVQA